MRKCILLFLLLVFVLIIASVSENKERMKDSNQVAMEDNAKNTNLQEKGTFSQELPN